jgi:hypothetical protein
MKAIIFLDIDGVLTTDAEYMRSRTKFWDKYDEAKQLRIPYPFNPGCVKVFNEILEKVDVDIVLSSDWRRHYTLEELDKIFKFNKVIKSPMATTEICPCSFSQLDKNRAHEIELYVNKYKIEKYVIIDDLDLEYFCPVEHFVKTTDREVIKQSNIKQKILKVLE